MNRTLVAGLLAAGALVAGCGHDDGDDGATTTAAPATTATTTGGEKSSKALTELARTRQLVSKGVEAYGRGDTAQATELVTDAYLEHFEFVEHDLNEADHELNEMLEHQIREELRDLISGGAAVSDVRKLHADIERGLDRAERKLKAAL